MSRLKEGGLRCEFHDLDREIKDQIVVHCKSDTLRRKALRDDPTLPDLVKYARSMETAETQAMAMELNNNNTSEIDKVSKTAGKYSSKYCGKQKEVQLCFKCGKQWPHPDGNPGLPAIFQNGMQALFKVLSQFLAIFQVFFPIFQVRF